MFLSTDNMYHYYNMFFALRIAEEIIFLIFIQKKLERKTQPFK